MRNICLLGATGSIGSQVLDLVKEKPSDYKLVAFAFGNKLDKAIKIIDEFHPEFVAGSNKEHIELLKNKYPNIEFGFGIEGLNACAAYDTSNPMVINSLVGSVGLTPTITALNHNRDVYLANKETLVIGGKIVMKLAKEKGLKIIPIDSEHSAIKQIIDGRNKEDIKRLIITASGGAFRDLTREELVSVTKDDALKHPNWNMGEKITIDCATMMNKGFELIEAHYLFDIPMDRIEPILHRESLVHSMVEFKDGSIFAQIGSSDMHLPIKYALEGPSHSASNCIEPLDIKRLSNIHFEELDKDRYPMIVYAVEALKKGDIYPTILNASNEASVRLFLDGKISFLDIERIVKEAVFSDRYLEYSKEPFTLDLILKVDNKVKEDVFNNRL